MKNIGMKIHIYKNKGTIDIRVTKHEAPNTITTDKYVDGNTVQHDTISIIGTVEVRLSDGAVAKVADQTLTDGVLWFDKFVRYGEVCWSLFAYDDTVDIDKEIPEESVPDSIKDYLR